MCRSRSRHSSALATAKEIRRQIVKGLAQNGFTGSVARANLKQATPSFKAPDQTPGQFSLTSPMRLRLRKRRRRASRNLRQARCPRWRSSAVKCLEHGLNTLVVDLDEMGPCLEPSYLSYPYTGDAAAGSAKHRRQEPSTCPGRQVA